MPVTMKKGMENRPLSMVARAVPAPCVREQPLGIRRGERLAEHHRQEQGEKPAAVVPLKGLKYSAGTAESTASIPPASRSPMNKSSGIPPSEQYKL